MRTTLPLPARISLIVCMVCFIMLGTAAVTAIVAEENNSTVYQPRDDTLGSDPGLMISSDLPAGKLISEEKSSGTTPPGPATSSVGVFRPSARQFILNTNPITRINFGLSTDKPITGDWDNDGKTEIGVFRPSSREFILRSANGATSRVTFGLSTDKPITGDWDGDGDTEIGVFRPSARQFILRNTGGSITRITFGTSTDIPLTVNWNDAGPTEVAVYRPSSREFIIRNSDGSTTRGTFGLSTDKPFTTWDDSGYTNVGVFRPSTRQFILVSPSTRFTFGLSTDIPITGKVWATSTTPPGPETEIINAHQYWRSQVGSPTLTWSSSEASTAQAWANQLAIDGYLHHNRAGQNAAKSGGTMTWTEVVDFWASEKQYFIYGPFDGVNPSTSSTTGDWMDIGHYTQVVWKTTTQCGCGKASGVGGNYYVCNYNPYGNYQGQYPY